MPRRVPSSGKASSLHGQSQRTVRRAQWQPTIRESEDSAMRFVARLLVCGWVIGATPSVLADDRGLTIETSGCVEHGVEAGCLVLKTAEGDSYTLFIQGSKKPEPTMAITIRGTKHAGPTMCMQGTPVDVESWTQIPQQCPAVSAGKK